MQLDTIYVPEGTEHSVFDPTHPVSLCIKLFCIKFSWIKCLMLLSVQLNIRNFLFLWRDLTVVTVLAATALSSKMAPMGSEIGKSRSTSAKAQGSPSSLCLTLPTQSHWELYLIFMSDYLTAARELSQKEDRNIILFNTFKHSVTTYY